MNIKISNIILSPDEELSVYHAAGALGINVSQINRIDIMKQSVDARRKNNIRFIYTVIAHVEDGCSITENENVSIINTTPDDVIHANKKYINPPVIVGMGPAGLFCGYMLAKYGYNPIIIERGSDVDTRTKAVEAFKAGGILDTECNIQFGEGGAGTFSDGKLTTRIGDSKCRWVLETLYKFGAPEEILYMAKPHIGTDILKNVVKNMRLEIEHLGGKVMFNSKLCGISGERIKEINVNGNKLPCEALVLAIGHSSRDTFKMLEKYGMFMEPKAFAVGVRIEHTQEFINKSQYGEAAGHPRLAAAEYFLKYNGKDHSCYSFCMCPGGEIVPAASEENTVVTNGMSPHLRNGEYANSGIVVTVSKEDFGFLPLDGVKFQQELERKAYSLGGGKYSAPGQYCGDFLNGNKTVGQLNSTYSRGVRGVDFSELFPDFITNTIKEGLLSFNKKIPGFAEGKVPLIGVESRTSSPVRLTRGNDFQSINRKGIYPCGEGAGYAGGIMSAAVDGIKVAIKIMEG